MIELFPTRQVIISLFGFSIHWYGVMYFLSFLLGYSIAKKIQKHRGLSLSDDQWSNLLVACVLGVLVGGRLGYVFLYEPAYFLHNPLQVFAVWKGGMASHGGFIGVSIALFYMVRSLKVPVLALVDIVVVPVAIGLALGRIGNFINLEIYGSITSVPWAISIPGVEGLRHPTQIYAFIKNATIASVCFFYLQKTSIFYHKRPVNGYNTALFLCLYSVFRFCIEFLRDQPYGYFHLGAVSLSVGQLYTISIFLCSICVFFYARRSCKIIHHHE